MEFEVFLAKTDNVYSSLSFISTRMLVNPEEPYLSIWLTQMSSIQFRMTLKVNNYQFFYNRNGIDVPHV
jgi:hypothetical protein